MDTKEYFYEDKYASVSEAESGTCDAPNTTRMGKWSVEEVSLTKFKPPRRINC